MTKDEAQDLVNELRRDLKIPPDTCPLIDGVLSAVKGVNLLCLRVGRNHSNLDDFAADVEKELWSTVAEMEQIRKHNEDLRELGKSWHRLASQIASECPDEEMVALAAASDWIGQ